MKIKLQSWLQEWFSSCKYQLLRSKLEPTHRKERTLVLALASATLLGLAGGLHAQGTFPSGPAVDPPFPTASPFLVTIKGNPYSAMTQDPAMVVTRSAATTEYDEGVMPVITTGYPNCGPNVSDADVGCFPPGLDSPPVRRELHAEMLSLNLVGTTGGYTVRYLAGQPAFDALNQVGAAAWYRNSCGEVVSLDASGNSANDFPARSFWAVRGVVKISPPPPGTSGVFFATDLILMDLGIVNSLPPLGSTYANYTNGRTNEDGTGAACGVLPVALYDATNPPPAPPVGQIESGATHTLLMIMPTLQEWGLITLMALLVIVGAVFLLRHRGVKTGVADAQ
jgi:IPTL-CTERM motif